MPRKNYQRDPADEELILDLVRLGLDQDAGSVRQLGRQVLRKGRGSASDDFRERLGKLLLDSAGSTLRGAATQPLPIEDESLMPLVERRENPVAEQPILDPQTEQQLQRLVEARTKATELLEAGIEPPSTLLLTGPPGVGKTMTATSLASVLGLPLLTVELSALMSSFLGRTGHNLRRVLDHARSEPCVLFLDEFDAVAKRRDDVTDIGELKRLVNLLLLEIEDWPIAGLLVAATNHPQLLDPAVERRFDVVVDLKLPGFEERRSILERASERYRHDEPPSDTVLSACALAFDGQNGSFLERAVAEAARIAVLEGGSFAQGLSLLAIAHLDDAAPPESRERRSAFAALANEQLGMSQREIAELLEVSHPTVGKLIKEWQTGRKKDAGKQKQRR
ncbi:MAG TPA: AAA family ATPase [Solirubrobacterales bacterium]|nr:AAA family ATPase [Solirubrobacterales bacterium]